MAIINGRGRVGIRRPSAAATPSIVLDGLKLYLDAGNVTSYAGTGTVWTDLSGNGNNGTLVNGPTYSSANFGFDGTNDFCNLGNADFFTGLTSLSISVWINPNPLNSFNPILARYDNTTRNNGFYLYYDNSSKKFAFDGRESTAAYLSMPTINTFIINNWYNVVATKSANIWSIYVNGILENSGIRGLGNVSFGVNPTRISSLITAYSVDYSKLKISNMLCYNRALSATEILQNYNTLKSRFYPQVSDADAQSFIYAANVQDATQASAVNTLVTSLKSAGIWTKMKAVYPFVGGSAASHKWNLKDPRDLNVAYRLTFTTGWVHSSTGALANGTSDYANTFYNLQLLNQNNTHLSLYQINNYTPPASSSIDMGAFDEVSVNGVFIASEIVTGLSRARLFKNALEYSLTDNRGYFLVNTNSTNTKYYINNVNRSTIANSGTFPLINKNIYIGNLNGTSNYFSPGKYTFASIGDGLTDTDASNLYTAVQAYQTSLGRQV